MKKNFCLLALLMAFNVHAADLDMAAVSSGKTNDSVCFVSSEVGNPTLTKAIWCGNKAGLYGNMLVKKDHLKVIADFIESGRWNLATSYETDKNITVLVFTKK